MSPLPYLCHRRWLSTSTAVHHELCQLELLWAWEPTASSRAFGTGESKEPKTWFFLMETRKKNSYLERLRCRLKFDNLFIVPRRNRGGGLALLLMDELNLHIRTFSPRRINTVINLGMRKAYETLHYLKEKRTCKMGYMALKLDM